MDVRMVRIGTIKNEKLVVRNTYDVSASRVFYNIEILRITGNTIMVNPFYFPLFPSSNEPIQTVRPQNDGNSAIFLRNALLGRNSYETFQLSRVYLGG